MQRDLTLAPPEAAPAHAAANGASRDLRFLSRTIAREYPAASAQHGVVLAFSCPDEDALCADFMLLQADALCSELESTVLLVDARGSRHGGGITERLGLGGLPGVSDTIAAGPGAPAPPLCATGAPGVFVLPAGGGPAVGTSSFELGLASLLTWARPRYRHVLLQVGSVVADTRDLVAALQADGIVLVAREHRTMVSALDEASAVLRENGARDVSAVLVEAAP